MMDGLRVVASLTTMPDRYEKVVKTLESLHAQTRKLDQIYLSLPQVSRRLNIPYPEVPERIRALCTIVSCTDYGPITKLVGGVLSEPDPQTVIISFDDDMLYPPGIVEALLRRHHEYPNAAIGSSGMLLKYKCPYCAITPNENTFLFRIPKFRIPPEGRRVDSVYGYPGALYVRKFFPEVANLESEFLKYALIDDNTYLNDDITISGYLSLRGIERRIFEGFPDVSFVVGDNGIRTRTENEISYDLNKFFDRMNATIETCKALGMYATTESMDASETILGISIVIVISILILLILIVVAYRSLPSSYRGPWPSLLAYYSSQME